MESKGRSICSANIKAPIQARDPRHLWLVWATPGLRLGSARVPSPGWPVKNDEGLTSSERLSQRRGMVNRFDTIIPITPNVSTMKRKRCQVNSVVWLPRRAPAACSPSLNVVFNIATFSDGTVSDIVVLANSDLANTVGVVHFP